MDGQTLSPCFTKATRSIKTPIFSLVSEKVVKIMFMKVKVIKVKVGKDLGHIWLGYIRMLGHP